MNHQQVWDTLVEVERHMEKARQTLRGLDPVALSMDRGRKPERIISNVSGVERDLNRAIAEVREACFRLAGDIAITVEEDEDFDPSDHIDP